MFTLKLHEPAILKLETANGQGSAEVDVFKAHRMLIESEKQPNEEARWAMVINYLSSHLGIAVSDLHENQARLFHECIVALAAEHVTRIAETQKKTVSSQLPIQVSPEAM